jgi:hypothetical protein
MSWGPSSPRASKRRGERWRERTAGDRGVRRCAVTGADGVMVLASQARAVERGSSRRASRVWSILCVAVLIQHGLNRRCARRLCAATHPMMQLVEHGAVRPERREVVPRIGALDADAARRTLFLGTARCEPVVSPKLVQLPLHYSAAACRDCVSAAVSCRPLATLLILDALLEHRLAGRRGGRDSLFGADQEVERNFRHRDLRRTAAPFLCELDCADARPRHA